MSAVAEGAVVARADQRRMATLIRTRAVEIQAALLFGAVSSLYLLGSGGSFGYDESITVSHFVATPSLADPFRREVGLNNHPLFSFADHLVYSLGGSGEIALRVLPIVFAAAAVAALSWFCARRWGLLAGAVAGALTASNPLFANEARQVRGYSLLALSAVAASCVLIRLLERSAPGPREPAERRLEIAYTLSLALDHDPSVWAAADPVTRRIRSLRTAPVQEVG